MHEGVSTPNVVGEGGSRIAWPRKAVESAAGFLKKGLKFFFRHNADSSHKGRPPVGEVVSSFAKQIGGVLHQGVIGYFPNKQEAMKYDICSIEADVYMSDAGPGLSIAEKIADITGIAVSNSNYEKPGFPGAARLGSLQAFESDDNTQKGDDGKSITPGKGDKMPTFTEIKQAVAEMNIHPSQLYSVAQIQSDREFSAVFDERDRLKTELEESQKKNETLETRQKEIERNSLKADASDRYKKLIPANVTEAQKKFLERKFNPDTASDLSDNGLRTFVESGLKEFKDFAEMGLINADSAPVVPGSIPVESGSVDLDQVVKELL